MSSRRMHALMACSLAAATAVGQSFTYTDFSNTQGLRLLGSTVQSGTALRLTTTQAQQTGLFWHTTAMPVARGFDTTFTFRITRPVSGTLAEGMAFIIHDDPNGTATQGGGVWALGYGVNSNPGIRNAIAIEIDTYQDGFLGDTSANEVSIHTRGALGCNEYEQYSIGRNTPAVSLSNAQVHTLRVVYVPGTVNVFVDNATTPSISVAYDLLTGGRYLNNQVAPAPTLANGTALAGFSATTGASGLWETVEILSWTWASTPLLDPCSAGTLGADVLTAEGSAGGFLREVDLFATQSFRIDVVSPPNAGNGMPFVIAASPVTAPGAPGTLLPFGAMCFPVLPLLPPSLLLLDSLGLGGALLPATTTPFTLNVPAGLLTQPLTLTLQGVIASSTAPLQFGITNALTVELLPPPTPAITTVTPLSAATGAPITINGSGFVPGLTLQVNGMAITPTSISRTQVVFPYPGSLPCSSQVAIVNPDQRQASAGLNPQPTVTNTVLNTGPAAGNALFIVQGTGFAVGTTATVGGAAATVVSATATAVTLRTPPGQPGQAQVVLTTPGGCQALTSYTYQ
ncbi:MAG: IPT/TIG domain-containing protein [Planctomycetes bacterium]|nr:IPT/TIG domain-containing protein [Planctomycetota bacterium]